MNKELSEYERGVIDGRQIQMQSSVDKAVNAMSQSQRTWVGLTDEEIESAIDDGFAFGLSDGNISNEYVIRYVRVIEAKLKEKNSA